MHDDLYAFIYNSLTNVSTHRSRGKFHGWPKGLRRLLQHGFMSLFVVGKMVVDKGKLREYTLLNLCFKVLVLRVKFTSSFLPLTAHFDRN